MLSIVVLLGVSGKLSKFRMRQLDAANFEWGPAVASGVKGSAKGSGATAAAALIGGPSSRNGPATRSSTNYGVSSRSSISGVAMTCSARIIRHLLEAEDGS